MKYVFLSYSRQDRETADRLATFLGRAGLRVFYDQGLVAGENWRSVIDSRLRDAGCVVTIWSKNSVQSDWVKYESSRAHERGILIPVSIDGTPAPRVYDDIQTQDLRDWDGTATDARATQLLRGVHAILAQSVATSISRSPSSDIYSLAQTVPASRRRILGRVLFVIGLVAVVAVYAAVVGPLPWNSGVSPASIDRFELQTLEKSKEMHAALDSMSGRDNTDVADGGQNPRPRKVRTVEVRPDGSVTPTSAANSEASEARTPASTASLEEPPAQPRMLNQAAQSAPEVAPTAQLVLSWPAAGKILSGFGDQSSDNRKSNGLHIALPPRTEVRAAQDGEIIYTGAELAAYGELILIRHANGWLTAYAHNAQLLVKRGEHVKKGAVIAMSGDTGDVSTPQLYFELRENNQAVDPTPYFAPH